jgi:hypothetical protein
MGQQLLARRHVECLGWRRDLDRSRIDGVNASRDDRIDPIPIEALVPDIENESAPSGHDGTKGHHFREAQLQLRLRAAHDAEWPKKENIILHDIVLARPQVKEGPDAPGRRVALGHE